MSLFRLREIKQKGWDAIAISAKEDSGLNRLRAKMFSELRFIRVYMKPVGKPADLNEPLILKEGDTVEIVCRKLHREFKDKFRHAAVSLQNMTFKKLDLIMF